MKNEMLKERIANTFWNEIFTSEEWCNSPENIREYVKDKAHAYPEDETFMTNTYRICYAIANQFASVACVYSEVTEIFDGGRKWKCLAFGWGDPHVTSEYYYAYFDFTEEVVFIDTNEGSNIYSFDEIFKIMYS